MPEGDTVWHSAAILRDALVGKTLTRCDIRLPHYATIDLTGETADEDHIQRLQSIGESELADRFRKWRSRLLAASHSR
jgi:formamidopyrimidine-DNA glycosylase